VEQLQEMVLSLEAFGQQFSSSYAQSHILEQLQEIILLTSVLEA
jgi:hypothetical protein